MLQSARRLDLTGDFGLALILGLRTPPVSGNLGSHAENLLVR
jgi:hypothetical protein